jgi:hypothetical protein
VIGHISRRTLLALLATVPLLSAAKCEDRGQAPQRGPAEPPVPWEAQRDLNAENKVVTISAWVEPEFCPYFVKMDATDHDTGEHVNTNEDPGDDPRGERVSGGQFRHTLAYPTRHNVELTVHVTASKPGSQRGYIAIRDGRHRRDASFGGTAVSVATIRTQR